MPQASTRLQLQNNTTQLNTTETNEPIASFTTVSRPSAHYQGRASADMLVTSAY
jgi:hypothetical protein